MLAKLEENPYIGEELHNRAGCDLRGYYKLYFSGTRYRIVYRLEEGLLTSVDFDYAEGCLTRQGVRDKLYTTFNGGQHEIFICVISTQSTAVSSR